MQLLETKLSRLKAHADKGFFIISAFRGNYSWERNMKRHRELQKDVREAGLGFVELWGAWIEGKGTPEEETVKELSLFVPYKPTFTDEEFFDVAVDQMFRYDQDAIVYRGPDDDVIRILDDDQDEIYTLGSFQPDKIADIYSEIKKGSHMGRTFIFEGYKKPSNSIGALAMKKKGFFIV